MIDKLKQIEDKLMLELLSKPEIWQTQFFEEDKPVIETLWTQINKYRISLNFFHTCERFDVAIKKNPWPCSVHIIHGSCEIGIGLTEKDLTIIHAPQGNFYCDMSGREFYYYIRDLKTVSSAVILSGEYWNGVELSEEELEIKPLGHSRKEILLEYFLNYYRAFYQNERIKENMSIQRGDWVEFDQMLMSDYDKKGFASVLNMRGFVIKRTETLIDARFGNDRFQVKSCFLKRLSVVDNQKPVDSTTTFVDDDIDEDDEDFDPDFL